MIQDVMKKLRMPEQNHVLIMNAPAQYIEEMFSLLQERMHTTSQGKYTFAQLFVYSIADLEQYAQQVIQSLEKGGLLWIAYPKKSSSIKTDINRDSGWDVLTKAEFEGVSLISIDETWSVMRFRSIQDKKSKARRTAIRKENTVKKVADMPEELKEAFNQHPEAKEKFEKLAPSYKKSFIDWVISAKRVETRQKRTILTIEKVVAGMKAPYN
jgi:hypothetical protein